MGNEWKIITDVSTHNTRRELVFLLESWWNESTLGWIEGGKEKQEEEEEDDIDVTISKSKVCHIQSNLRRRLIGRRRFNVRHVKEEEDEEKRRERAREREREEKNFE